MLLLLLSAGQHAKPQLPSSNDLATVYEESSTRRYILTFNMIVMWLEICRTSTKLGMVLPNLIT
jgi:hypothetical protein